MIIRQYQAGRWWYTILIPALPGAGRSWGVPGQPGLQIEVQDKLPKLQRNTFLEKQNKKYQVGVVGYII